MADLPQALPQLIDFTLLGFLVAMAFAIARLRDLFAAIMLTGIFSLLSAGLFVTMDAVDVAFTEAAVGAGISTVLMLGTLALTDSREKPPQAPSIFPLLVVLLTGAALVYGTLDMPHFGDPSAPAQQRLAPEFVADEVPVAENSAALAHYHPEAGHSEEGHGDDEHREVYADEQGRVVLHVGIPNLVTTLLASYRGYDTFGETTVIFTAGVGVLMLLGGRRRDDAYPERLAEIAAAEAAAAEADAAEGGEE